MTNTLTTLHEVLEWHARTLRLLPTLSEDGKPTLIERKPPEGYLYASMYECVLARGQKMGSAPLSREQAAYVTQVTRGSRYPIKQCFSNSQRVLWHLGRANTRLRYFEGYATSGLMPVLHGWLVLDDRHLIDLTWRHPTRKHGTLLRTRIIGEIPEGYEYIGFEVADFKAIGERIRKTGEWSTFLDDWRNRYPLLKATGT